MPNNIPGATTASFTSEIALFAQGPNGQTKSFDNAITIKSTVTDSGNTPTSVLRPGLGMAIKTSDGLGYVYDPDANDGTQNMVGLIPEYSGLSMLESLINPTAVDKFTFVRAQGILKRPSTLPNADKASMARLLRNGYTTAGNEPHGSAFGLHFRQRVFKAADYTVVDDDHGTLFYAITGAVNFTLPVLATVGRGFEVMFYNTVDANMVITSAADKIVYGDAGGALSTTLTFSTANKKMGGQAIVYSDYVSDGGALAWFVYGVVGATSA